MLVTLLGMVMPVKPVQFWNALVPMLVTLLGMVMLVKPVQFWNALVPMLVTLLPMVTLVKFVQLRNASVGIEVTVALGMIRDTIRFNPASPGTGVLLVLPVENAPLLVLPLRSSVTNLLPVLSIARRPVVARRQSLLVPMSPKLMETFRGTGFSAVPACGAWLAR